ncbi:hypothetical protein R3P38DRAFT_3040069 [Favolaschia claudopus]|uniref:Uncharacterized protein n=1 Tax=Favolaschia claudopus TaxID=2862362 RepID=A0AAW0AB81_9AGAR
MASTRSDAANLQSMNGGLMYYMFGLVAQTFFFGIYTILIWLSTRMLLQRKLKTRINKAMFGITTSTYILTLAYWAYSVADGVDRMYQYEDQAVHPSKIMPDHTDVTQWSPLFNALMLINYVVGDGVVVWRAWIICQRNHRKYLWIAIVFLAITAITVALTIGFRIVGVVVSPIKNLPKDSVLAQGIDILQVTTLFTSLLSNLTATGVVAATALNHWRSIRSAFSESKANALRTNRILLLVIETGALYCISALIVFISAFIRLPHGTVGDLYQPINTQIAGAYPTIVLLLVSTKKSLSESSFADTDSSGSMSTVSQPIRFGTELPSAHNSIVSKPIPIHFARNPLLSVTDSESVLDISPNRGSRSREKPGEHRRLSDDSFV